MSVLVVFTALEFTFGETETYSGICVELKPGSKCFPFDILGKASKRVSFIDVIGIIAIVHEVLFELVCEGTCLLFCESFWLFSGESFHVILSEHR